MSEEPVPYRTLKKSKLIPPPPGYPKSLTEQNPLHPSAYDKPPVLPKGQPEWLTVEDAIAGARSIQEVLSRKEWEARWDSITTALFERAVNPKDPAANKAAELLLNYRYGKPVALDVNVTRDYTAEQIAALAKKVKTVDTTFND